MLLLLGSRKTKLYQRSYRNYRVLAERLQKLFVAHGNPKLTGLVQKDRS